MKKFLVRLLKFCAIPVLFSYLFVWFYEQPQREANENGTSEKALKWTQIKDNPNQFDVVILGSSRGYSAYNPAIIDSITGLNSYNMCTGSQHIIESIYMLKEILKTQKPMYLVYEVFLPSFDMNPDMFQVFSNAHFMSNEMILNEFMDEKILDLVFPIWKHKSYLKNDLRNLTNSVSQTIEPEEIPWIKGYKPSNAINDSISISQFNPVYSFSNTKALPKNKIMSYLLELIEVCQENGVEPIFIRAPYPPSRMKKTLTDDVHSNFSAFFKTQNIQFYDLNYTSKLSYSDYDFEDSHHMNSNGASKASRELSEILIKRSKNINN